MSDERSRIPTGDLMRWLFVALLLAIGIVLYFRYAPGAPRVVTPTMQDSNP